MVDSKDAQAEALMATVQINYKSGQSVTLKCKTFAVTKSSNGLSVEWENPDPHPLLIGVSEIESIWEL